MTAYVLLRSALVAISVSAVAAEPVKLEFKHVEGSSATVRTTLALSQTLTISGMNIDTRAQNTTTVTRTVGKRSADGRLPIAQKVDALLVQLNGSSGI